MTQKELMLKGEYYDSSDKELTDDRRKAKRTLSAGISYKD